MRVIAMVLFCIGGSASMAQSAPRSSAYFELGMAATAHPLLGQDWPQTVPISVDVRLGGGIWLGQRIGVFALVGVMPKLTAEGPGSGQLSKVEETLSLLPIHGGAKLNIWPRIDWIQLNLVGTASVLYGSQKLSFGNTVQAKNNFLSFGFGAGVELNLVKAKQTGLSLSANYFVQPTSLPMDQGFRTQGDVDLGGLEIMLSLMGFFGAPQ